MDRINQLASAMCSKTLDKIETELKYNSFYSESDKRTIRTLLGNRDSREINKNDIEKAIKISEKLIAMNCDNYNYYVQRQEKLLEDLEQFN